MMLDVVRQLKHEFRVQSSVSFDLGHSFCHCFTKFSPPRHQGTKNFLIVFLCVFVSSWHYFEYDPFCFLATMKDRPVSLSVRPIAALDGMPLLRLLDLQLDHVPQYLIALDFVAHSVPHVHIEHHGILGRLSHEVDATAFSPAIQALLSAASAYMKSSKQRSASSRSGSPDSERGSVDSASYARSPVLLTLSGSPFAT
jgi:hypothetical protein